MRRPGYAGKLLRVDLTRGRLTVEPTTKYADRFVGGRGINAGILFNELGPTVRPLDPENMVLFGVGPLLGGRLPELHQADFLCTPPHSRMEVAFAPNDGLHEGWLQAVTPRGRANRDILTSLQPALPPPVHGQSDGQQQEDQNHC